MHHRTLGRTDLKLAEVGLGTWGLGAEAYGSVSEEDFERTVETALDSGATTFDMAPLWGDGRAERIVGRVTHRRRDEVAYVTRGGAVYRNRRVEHRFDREALVGDCEASLKRLETDRIDLWLLHNPPVSTWKRDEWRQAVEQLKNDGKIRAWGAAVGSLEPAREAVSAGAEAICIPYNMLGSAMLDELSDEVSVAGCGVLACSPLAYGLLAGKWSDTHDFRADDHRAQRWSPRALRERLRHAGLLRFLVHDDVTSLASAAIRYVLANPLVTSVLVGAREPDQIVQATECSTGSPYLPQEDLARVAQVLAAAESD